MIIKEHSVEKLNDPTGIIIGDRYEMILNIEVSEDDELYSEKGLYIKVIYAVDEKGYRIAQYQIFEKMTNEYLDFGLEEEEKTMVNDYCKQMIKSME